MVDVPWTLGVLGLFGLGMACGPGAPQETTAAKETPTGRRPGALHVRAEPAVARSDGAVAAGRG